MTKAVSTISFYDNEEEKIQNLKVIIEDDYRVSVKWLDPTAEPPPPVQPETLGDKVEKAIDWATGGKLKKCGACERRKALINKLAGEKNEG